MSTKANDHECFDTRLDWEERKEKDPSISPSLPPSLALILKAVVAAVASVRKLQGASSSSSSSCKAST